MSFLPDGRLLVTEKKGRLLIVTQNGDKSEPLAGVPDVDYGGQGGFGDIVLHPEFAQRSEHSVMPLEEINLELLPQLQYNGIYTRENYRNPRGSALICCGVATQSHCYSGQQLHTMYHDSVTDTYVTYTCVAEPDLSTASSHESLSDVT